MRILISKKKIDEAGYQQKHAIRRLFHEGDAEVVVDGVISLGYVRGTNKSKIVLKVPVPSTPRAPEGRMAHALVGLHQVTVLSD